MCVWACVCACLRAHAHTHVFKWLRHFLSYKLIKNTSASRVLSALNVIEQNNIFKWCKLPWQWLVNALFAIVIICIMLLYLDFFFVVSAAHGYAPIQFQQRPVQNGPIPTPNGQQTHEMNIPNDLIGCIIGRGGQKINEIR